jgi:hypothetical protein
LVKPEKVLINDELFVAIATSKPVPNSTEAIIGIHSFIVLQLFNGETILAFANTRTLKV